MNVIASKNRQIAMRIRFINDSYKFLGSKIITKFVAETTRTTRNALFTITPHIFHDFHWIICRCHDYFV